VLLATIAAPANASRPVSYRDALLRAINAARGAQHLPPLRPEPHLGLAARRYSRVLARTSQLTHNALGEDVAQRLAAAGFRGSRFGENLAVGMTAAQTVAAWLASPPHRAILLSPQFRRVGLGVSAGRWQGAAVQFVTADLGG
jgi:uncharacterized protein YkwD